VPALGQKPNKEFLVDFRFHDLRHEATTRFFEQRLELMEVASITGHKTLTMLRRYTHLRAEDLAKKLA
jgi:integrase